MKKSLLIFPLLILFLSMDAQIVKYNVLFDFNKSEVPDSSQKYLEKYVQSKKIAAVKLSGHCDSVGNKEYNYALSERRVQAVLEVLQNAGLETKFFRGKKGWGKDKPLNDNTSVMDRQKNRRVELQFFHGKNIRLRTSAPKTIVQERPAVAGVHYSKAEYKVGEVVSFPGLNFQGGRHYLLKSSVPTLDTIINILKNNPSLKVEVQGHVCCTSVETDGLDMDTGTHNLSENRAHAIAQSLMKRGIEPSRIRTKGFGGSKKINLSERTESEMVINRRVEFLILEN